MSAALFSDAVAGAPGDDADDNGPSNPLCVFDLDETLVHSEAHQFDGAVFVYKHKDLSVFTRLRPHARELLESVAGVCDVAIWSAGSPLYVRYIVATFFRDTRFRFIWSSSDCLWTLHDDGYFASVGNARAMMYKPLSLVERRHRYPLRRIVVVDDTEATAFRNVRNLVHVPRFNPTHAGANDATLRLLEQYLLRLFCLYRGQEVGDVDKRGWLEEVVQLESSTSSDLLFCFEQLEPIEDE